MNEEPSTTVTALAFSIVVILGWGFVVVLNIMLGIRDNQIDFIARIPASEARIEVQEKRLDIIAEEVLEIIKQSKHSK